MYRSKIKKEEGKGGQEEEDGKGYEGQEGKREPSQGEKAENEKKICKKEDEIKGKRKEAMARKGNQMY